MASQARQSEGRKAKFSHEATLQTEGNGRSKNSWKEREASQSLAPQDEESVKAVLRIGEDWREGRGPG
ncbi:MAG TPA: hypothetical protein VD713_02010, partial [Sphingomonadales bacterium]|nr:hypothetical protein [Sphingomonadales bacterium]